MAKAKTNRFSYWDKRKNCVVEYYSYSSKSICPQAPYPIVIVELANKERMIGQLVDWTNDDLVFGREVVAVLRRTRIEEKDDVISYNIKFRPV